MVTRAWSVVAGAVPLTLTRVQFAAVVVWLMVEMDASPLVRQSIVIEAVPEATLNHADAVQELPDAIVAAAVAPNSPRLAAPATTCRLFCVASSDSVGVLTMVQLSGVPSALLSLPKVELSKRFCVAFSRSARV